MGRVLDTVFVCVRVCVICYVGVCIMCWCCVYIVYMSGVWDVLCGGYTLGICVVRVYDVCGCV